MRALSAELQKQSEELDRKLGADDNMNLTTAVKKVNSKVAKAGKRKRREKKR